jgi:hypothetical protein
MILTKNNEYYVFKPSSKALPFYIHKIASITI